MDSRGKFLIKICGVTSPDDAAFAAGEGADAIGINFWDKSKRYIRDREAARRVVGAIPPGVLRVGVFVNAAASVVLETVADLGLDRAQLHGLEKPADFEGLPRESLIRATGILNKYSFTDLASWKASLYVYDAFTVNFGGEGVTAPWELIAECPEHVGPFLLAGGLTPENVGAAIALTRPNGVDVASGVESAPGRKDPAKVRAFILNARRAAQALLAAADP